MKAWAWLVSIILMSLAGGATNVAAGAAIKRHHAMGMVLRVDKEHRSIEVSCDEIPDYMAAMEMSFKVRDSKWISDLKPGVRVGFAIVEEGKDLFAEDIHAQTAAVFEPEPMEAGGLTALHKALNPAAATRGVKVGQSVPDFALTDQTGSEVRLSQFHGKVV